MTTIFNVAQLETGMLLSALAAHLSVCDQSVNIKSNFLAALPVAEFPETAYNCLMDSKSKNRGGARPGAGRHTNVAKGIATTQKMTLYLTSAQTLYVREKASERAVSPSEVVRGMVQRIMEMDGVANR